VVLIGAPIATLTSSGSGPNIYKIEMDVPSSIRIYKAELYYKSNLATGYTKMNMNISGNHVSMSNLSFLKGLEYDVYIIIKDYSSNEYESDHIQLPQ